MFGCPFGTVDDLTILNDNPELLLAQGLFYRAQDGISHERNVDPTSGRPRVAGNQDVGSCRTNAAFQNAPLGPFADSARRWRHVPKSEAEKAQSNITNKRRRDGRDRRGRWKTPIFANLEPEPDGDGYVLMLANDPERDVRE